MHCLISFSEQLCGVGTLIIPISQMRTLKLRDGKERTKSHTTVSGRLKYMFADSKTHASPIELWG